MKHKYKNKSISRPRITKMQTIKKKQQILTANIGKKDILPTKGKKLTADFSEVIIDVIS